MHRWNRKITNWRWDGLLSYDLYHFCLVLRLHLFNTNITMMHNSYMILKMMFWISFCSDFFVTNFTIMTNDFLSLETLVWIFISLDSQFWRWISKMVLLIRICFGSSVTKFAIIMKDLKMIIWINCESFRPWQIFLVTAILNKKDKYWSLQKPSSKDGASRNRYYEILGWFSCFHD